MPGIIPRPRSPPALLAFRPRPPAVSLNEKEKHFVNRIPPPLAFAGGAAAPAEGMAPGEDLNKSLIGCFTQAKAGASQLSDASIHAKESAGKYATSAESKKAAAGFLNCIGQCIPDMDDAEVTTFSNGCCICCVSSHHTPMEFT
jgi:hypothetical protein